MTVPFFGSLSLWFLSKFTQHFLNTGESSKIANGLLNLVRFGSSFLFCATLISYGEYVNRLTSYEYTLFPPLILLSAIICMKRDRQLAVLFIGAFGFFILGNIAVAMRDLSLLPMSFITRFGMQVGSGSEVLLLSLALAHRIRNLREDKMLADVNVAHAEETLRIRSQAFMKSEKIADIAVQAAHDIRSPLSALNIVLSLETSLPDKSRSLMRAALERINDIANGLLDRDKLLPAEKAEPGGGRNPSPELISSTLESIISEKRIQYGERENVKINLSIEKDSYGCFALIYAADLKRVISNLVNNSYEAIEQSGNVNIRLFTRGQSINIAVKDDGKGIDPTLLTRIGKFRITSGKVGLEGGFGLGLLHAFESIQKVAGKITVDSRLQGGTTVTISLPRIIAPDWFLEELNLSSIREIVIVDDDPIFHDLWSEKFLKAFSSDKQFTISHFHSPEKFRAAFESDKSAKTLFYLIDFEFAGSNETGLDLAAFLPRDAKIVLVTSHYSEKKVQDSAAKLGIKILPKNLAEIVPILF